MARKSRKACRQQVAETIEPPVKEVEKIPTALYCRLSIADKKTGKESMPSQLNILRQFVSTKDDLEIAGEFMDDGFTGTNFRRPQFEEMMDGIRNGRYKCMVVKDLSRLGRSYLETSDLLEMELPMYGCRFISVTDHIDSEVSQIDSILVGLKNIMNQQYAEDISRKIKSVIRQKMARGEMLSGKPPYGYKKDPQNKGYLIEDEETADNVRQIFQLKLLGLTDKKIAEFLTEEGIINPAQYRELRDHGVVPEKKEGWTGSMVCRLTRNCEYVGHMVYGKTKEKQYLGQKQKMAPREDWIVRKNINPPIISQETFDMTQEIRARMRKGLVKRCKVM